MFVIINHGKSPSSIVHNHRHQQHHHQRLLIIIHHSLETCKHSSSSISIITAFVLWRFPALARSHSQVEMTQRRLMMGKIHRLMMSHGYCLGQFHPHRDPFCSPQQSLPPTGRSKNTYAQTLTYISHTYHVFCIYEPI